MQPDTSRRTSHQRGAAAACAAAACADTARTDRSNGSRLAGLNGRGDRLRTLVAAVAFVAAVALVLSVATAPATARFPIDNVSNVDDAATVTPSGANVAVTGWIQCTDGEIAEVRITVSQGDTAATGKTHVRCAGLDERQSWTIHVSPRGPDTFDAARNVSVDARAVPRARGQRTDDPHVWSNDEVSLLPR